jgi:hypothetical protein
MTQSLVESSLYRLDPRFARSGWYKAIDLLKPWLLPVLGILCVGQVIATRLDGSWLQDTRARWLRRLAAALAGIAILTVLMHWLAFRLVKLPLPLGRTGIYLVPDPWRPNGCAGASPLCLSVLPAIFCCASG